MSRHLIIHSVWAQGKEGKEGRELRGGGVSEGGGGSGHAVTSQGAQGLPQKIRRLVFFLICLSPLFFFLAPFISFSIMIAECADLQIWVLGCGVLCRCYMPLKYSSFFLIQLSHDLFRIVFYILCRPSYLAVCFNL